MQQRIIQVDAFTNRPFGGNPAAVCILSEQREEGWLRNVAREMNISETAFLIRQDDGFHLRWFTPEIEVELCGHATLASAHVLWEEHYLKPEEQARFHTLSGLLTARQHAGWIELNFPARETTPVTTPANLVESLGSPIIQVERSQHNYLVELASEEVLLALRPNFSQLAQLDAQGVIVTSRASRAGYDFVSRYFAPNAGINEDPVTGSAHCSLALYWQERLGKESMLAYQASSRGGIIRVSVQGDRVIIGGQAVTVMRGDLV